LTPDGKYLHCKFNSTFVFSRKSPEDEAFDIIRDMLVEGDNGTVNRRDLLRRCAYRGVVEEVAERCNDNLLASGVLMQDEQNRVRYALVN
jgi:hypothetical protein